MSTREYARMREAEETHWWYRTLRALVAGELGRSMGHGGVPRVLDAGCGTGGGLVRWAKALGARCCGVDTASEALSHCRERGERLIAQASVGELPFREAVFDAVVSLDVLCLHGVDEDRALSEFRRVLRAGGLLILNLPAFEALRGEHDAAVRIRGRSTRGEVERLLARSGFEVVRSSYWNALLLPLVWLVRHLRSGRPDRSATSDLVRLPGPLNTALAALLAIEGGLVTRTGLPFGTSILCAARKAGGAG